MFTLLVLASTLVARSYAAPASCLLSEDVEYGGQIPLTSPATYSSLAPQQQVNAPWHLARLGQPTRLTTMDNATPVPVRAQSRNWGFRYDDNWGAGVLVYVVDSGVRATHQELTGRVEPGFVIPRVAATGTATTDVCDHGTGVASLIAGSTVGIARRATIVPIRIADTNTCSRGATTNDDVAAGINLAVDNFLARTDHPRAGIINVSWQAYNALNVRAAFVRAIAANMHITVSAGNVNKNQCAGGPEPAADQRVQDVGQIVVGNIDWTDARDEGASNFGPCISLFAPGSSIVSAKNNGDAQYNMGGIAESGTSFATPLVAGVIAAMVTTNGNQSPANMKAALLNNARHPAGLSKLNGSPDYLLQSLLANPTLQ